MAKLKPFYRTKNKNIDVSDYIPSSTGVIEYFVQPQNFNRVFVSDPYQAAAIYDLTGLKTLQPFHMNALRVLGFELKQVDEPVFEFGAKNGAQPERN
jgi:hypothetical protein